MKQRCGVVYQSEGKRGCVSAYLYMPSLMAYTKNKVMGIIVWYEYWYENMYE